MESGKWKASISFSLACALSRGHTVRVCAFVVLRNSSKIYCILIWFHKLHKLFASTSTKMWPATAHSLSLSLTTLSLSLAQADWLTVSWTGKWRVGKPQHCLRHWLVVLSLSGQVAAAFRQFWPCRMTVMYEHKNVPYSPCWQQPKLPQFAAVYNLATHQSVRPTKSEREREKNETIANKSGQCRPALKLERARRMACAVEHFRFRLRFCECMCMCVSVFDCLLAVRQVANFISGKLKVARAHGAYTQSFWTRRDICVDWGSAGSLTWNLINIWLIKVTLTHTHARLSNCCRVLSACKWKWKWKFLCRRRAVSSLLDYLCLPACLSRSVRMCVCVCACSKF